MTEFFYNFVIFAAGDMEVYLDDALQVSGYEVVGAGDKEGGKVVFEKAPASGVLVTLSRRRDKFQFRDGPQVCKRVHRQRGKDRLSAKRKFAG